MRPASTARLMALFMATTVATSLALIVASRMTFGFGRLPYYVALFLIALGGGWIQSRILAWHRRPLPRWAIATALGTLASALLGTLTAREALSVAGPLAQGNLSLWLQILSRSVTTAACLGTAQALAIWGKRWTSDTLLWLAGLLVVRLLASAMPPLLREASAPVMSIPLLSHLVAPLLAAAVVGAGTAWLLDRLVFRVPAGQPFEAGARTVE